MPRDGLLRFARNDGTHIETARSHTGTRNIFFSIFVDGMFTTFIVRLFTNTSHVLRQKHAISCV